MTQQAAGRAGSEVLVVGAGVIGLTTAVCLAEAGLAVRVAAAEPPAQTTSAAAGALWGPHLVGMDERILPWAADTAATLTELTGGPAGELDGVVRMESGLSVTADAGGQPDVAIGDAVAPADPAQIPAGYRAGWRLTAHLIAMPEYLGYLEARLRAAGGTTASGTHFATLAEARDYAPAARVVVNCAGAGARELARDQEVLPVRGQAVVVRNPGLTRFFVGDGGPRELTYFFPHRDVVVLGGTEEPGVTSREPDPATAAAIVAACAAVAPELAGAQVLGHRVGLRPFRPSVRLEAVPPGQAGGVTVVHNYGHGGAGVTLSWGCARDAAALVLAALRA